MRRVLVGSLGGVVVGVFVALVVLNALAVGSPAHISNGGLGSSMGVKLVIQVHRADGRVQTFVKNGDLALLNFAKYIMWTILGLNDPERDGAVTDTSGNVLSGTYYERIGQNPSQIWLGNTSSPSVTLSDYTFNAPIKFNVQDVDLTTAGNNMTIDIFGSYVVQNNFNVTEVGLAIQLNYNGGYVSVLILHDALPTPIHLNAGDGITVHYYIYINNP